MHPPVMNQVLTRYKNKNQLFEDLWQQAETGGQLSSARRGLHWVRCVFVRVWSSGGSCNPPASSHRMESGHGRWLESEGNISASQTGGSWGERKPWSLLVNSAQPSASPWAACAQRASEEEARVQAQQQTWCREVCVSPDKSTLFRKKNH